MVLLRESHNGKQMRAICQWASKACKAYCVKGLCRLSSRREEPLPNCLWASLLATVRTDPEQAAEVPVEIEVPVAA